jgi:hypothetical protein
LGSVITIRMKYHVDAGGSIPFARISESTNGSTFGATSNISPLTTTLADYTYTVATANMSYLRIQAINSAGNPLDQFVDVDAVSYSCPPSITSLTFTESPVLCSDLTIKAGQPINFTNYVSIVSGSMPANPNITAVLKYGATTIVTLTNPSYNSGTGLLTWAGSLGSDVVVPAGQAIALEITTAQSGVAFRIDYDSQTKPSKIELPVSSYIDITSYAVYNAPYPAGSIITNTATGLTVYPRAVVSDPFGFNDITGMDITITPPGTTVSATSVSTAGCTRTYEYTWNTTGLDGTYSIPATAKEGLENTVTDVHALSFDVFIPPGPGGVSAGLLQWLRADVGTTIATGVSVWADQSAAGRTATQGTGANQPLFVSNAINFNPALSLNGTSQFMQFSDVGMVTGANARSSYALATTGIADGTHRYLTQYGTAANGQSHALLNQGNEARTAGWAANHLVPGGVWTTINIPRLVYGDYTGTLARGSFNGNAISSTAFTWNTSLNTTGYVGTRTGITEYWNGRIAEVIQYNSILSIADRNKVHSYLAIKYGITLDQTVAQNYTASDGSTVFWNGTTNSGHNNNIAGIARDDNSVLTQKQSKSINAGLQVVIGNGNTIAASNATNTSTFSANRSALVWGDNAGSVTSWTATGAPAGRQIITRTWKVQETGTVGSVKIQITDNGGTNGLPAEATTVYLLTDADGNFSSGATSTAMTLNGTNWEADVNLTSGQFFTFATEGCEAKAPVLTKQ